MIQYHEIPEVHEILVFKPHKKLVVKSYTTWVIIMSSGKLSHTIHPCGLLRREWNLNVYPLSVVVLQIWRLVSWVKRNPAIVLESGEFRNLVMGHFLIE